MKSISRWFFSYQVYIYIFLLVSLSSLHLFFDLKNSGYFSTDDFAVLNLVSNYSFSQIVKNTLLHGDIFGFRKLIGYVIFKINFDVFGINSLPYSLTNFVLHTTNVILIFLISLKISGKKFTSFFSAVLFNKIYLFYFSNIHEYLVTTFALLTIYLFTRSKKTSVFSLIFFILALLSKEVAFSIPLMLLGTAFILPYKKIKQIIPYLYILFIYAAYQLSFFLNAKGLPTSDSYRLAVDVMEILKKFSFYINNYFLILLVSLPLIVKKKISFAILLASFITLFPSLFLINRIETYYFYLPFSYICIFLAVTLPKLSLKTSILYILIIIVLGSRAILPLIPKQDYPNWQKVSMEKVITRVNKTLPQDKNQTVIDLSDINLERDAKLMLESNILNLFIDKRVGETYKFRFDEMAKTLTATK